VYSLIRFGGRASGRAGGRVFAPSRPLPIVRGGLVGRGECEKIRWVGE
jgi:hypothetical protein